MKHSAICVENIEFSVEDRSWGDKEILVLQGKVKVGVGAELGNVLGESVCIYQDISFGVKRLPEEIQQKLLDVYKDIETFVVENQDIREGKK
jgi:hypothetical protein